MKKFYKQKMLWVCLIMLPITMMGQEPFITVWKPDNDSAYISGHTSSSNQQIWFPGIGTNYTIEWEEIDAEASHNGTMTDITTTEGNPVLIDFGAPQAGGLYRVKVLPAGFESIRFCGGIDWNLIYGDHEKIIDITQWGDVAWNSMFYAFAGCWNLTMSATDVPNISAVTDMSYMFFYALSFNQSLDDWNVSNVTDMSYMFWNAGVFNQPLDNWNVSNVTNMERMFSGAYSFNQELNGWNTSNVTNMSYMFSGTYAFNQSLNNWNVGNVTDMSGMFYFSQAFNQSLDNWDVSNVTDMGSMFEGATKFNQPLSSWNVSSVTTMDGMFLYASAFNQPLNSWNVGNVNYMDDMLSYCGMSCQNYDATLIDWAALPTLQSYVMLGAGNLHYTSQEAVAARDSLIQLHGWYIDGDSHDADCYTAIFEHDDNSYQLFPNPANNFVKITGEDIERIDLYNIVGQLIHSKKISKNHASTIQLSTECYEIGSYLLHIINQEGKTVVKRLVIAR